MPVWYGIWQANILPDWKLHENNPTSLWHNWYQEVNKTTRYTDTKALKYLGMQFIYSVYMHELALKQNDELLKVL